jgi:phosphatidylglycerophosphate synthase
VSGGDQKADCYSGGEHAAMEFTQRVRGVAFGPLLRLLTALRVTPDHLTLLSLLFGLAFCPLFFYAKGWAFVALALHVLIDGLDGPLARHTGVASRAGSFTDSTADQVVIAASTATLMYAEVAGILPGALYIFFYTVVVYFAMARNALNTPYSWLLRPRFIVYVWFIVETYWWPGTLDIVLWISTALLALKMGTGFLAIRNRM